MSERTQQFYESERNLSFRCPKCGYDETQTCDELVMEDGDYYEAGVLCPKCGYEDYFCGPTDAPFQWPGSEGAWDRPDDYTEEPS